MSDSKPLPSRFAPVAVAAPSVLYRVDIEATADFYTLIVNNAHDRLTRFMESKGIIGTVRHVNQLMQKMENGQIIVLAEGADLVSHGPALAELAQYKRILPMYPFWACLGVWKQDRP